MIRNYIKIAWRNLHERKVFSFINILGLAIGFSSTFLIYLFLSHHLSFDSFHSNSDRIYRMVSEQHQDGIDFSPSVPPAFSNTFKENYDYAEKVAKIVYRFGFVMAVKNGATRAKFKHDVAFVEQDFFDIFNFPLLDGSNGVLLNAPNKAVITENIAKELFGTSDAVGKTFVLENDNTIQITGVLKNIPETSFLNREIFISFVNLQDFFGFAAGENWGGITTNLECYALLKPNQDITAIETALLELPKKHRPRSTNKHVYKLQPLSDVHVNPLYGGLNPVLLWIFTIIGLFLIAIACINFINISTAQAFYRSKEIGIRKVLGSVKSHLFWQFISEAFVLSFFSVAAGFLFAQVALPLFNELFQLQLSLRDLLNPGFFGFLLLLLALVSLVSGSYPGILMAKIIPVLALKGKLTQKDIGGQSTRKVLVVLQFSISIVLIAATIIISKQIDYAINTDLGFEKESIVMVNIPKEIDPIPLNGLKERFQGIPGVRNVAACLGSPGASDNSWSTNVKFGNRPNHEEFGVQAKIGDINYLKTFNIPLVAGRNFIKSDSPTEVLVNERFVEKMGFTSFDEVLGQKLEAAGGDVKATIVGLTKNFHDQSFTQDINPVFITPNTNWYGEIALKIDASNAKAILDQFDTTWSEAFSGYVFEYWFLDDRVAEQYATEQRYLSLSKVFSGLAIIIGCMGLYGLILFFVGQRKKEVGIRKVLGSDITSILNLFFVDFLKLMLIAGAIAIPFAWYFMELWLEGYAYRTEIRWWHFAVSILIVLTLTFITISYQTVKVALENPIKSLRTE
ncbi:MAG: ABC transporter permease [Bacteroidota bacterium]